MKRRLPAISPGADDAARNAVEPGSSAHTVGDRMISARTVAADPEPADNLAAVIERAARRLA
jgi:hypothetical protein